MVKKHLTHEMVKEIFSRKKGLTLHVITLAFKPSYMHYYYVLLGSLASRLSWMLAFMANSGGSSVGQNKLLQLILGHIYILKYLQSNFIGKILFFGNS